MSVKELKKFYHTLYLLKQGLLCNFTQKKLWLVVHAVAVREVVELAQKI